MRMRAAAALFVLLAAGGAGAQTNRCVNCHFANFSRVPAPEDLARWDVSPHARHGVGCDRCHGGDPTTYQPQDAHRGVLNGRNPLSSVNPRNVALTCAACHAGVAAAFRLSAHASGALEPVPNCTTCHGAMAAQVPASNRLSATCAGCHGARTPTADYPVLLRARIDALRSLEQTLDRVESEIASLENSQRRNRLAAELLLARAAWRNAADAVHTFDFRSMDDQRAIAERWTGNLLAALAAPN